MNELQITLADKSDTAELLELYRAQIGGAAKWDENYPNGDTVAFDLSRNALFVMKDSSGRIAAAVSIDEDEAVDSLPCWNRELFPSAEFSRLCVREDMRGRGIAKKLLHHIFDIMRSQGMKGVHILVIPDHMTAIGLYHSLGFADVGECDLFGRHFTCLEMLL